MADADIRPVKFPFYISYVQVMTYIGAYIIYCGNKWYNSVGDNT
jgi:hypothetical protein